MENTSNSFLESIDELAILESQQFDFNLQAANVTEPGDEDEDEAENEDESEDVSEDNSQRSDGDNPPLDPNIVHSPVTPQPGGNPRKP